MYEDIKAVYLGEGGRPLIFQPRLKHWFDVNYATGNLPEEYKGKILEEIYEEVDVAPREVWGHGRIGSEHGGYFSLKIVDRDEVEIWTRRVPGRAEMRDDQIITEIKTPVGEIRQIQRVTEHGTSLINSEYFLKEIKDMRVYEYVLQNRSYMWDENRYEWGNKRYGNKITLRGNLERIPIMWLIVGLMGFQKTVTMLWRHPKEMEAFMNVLEEEHIKQIETYRGKPVDELNFVDNMHQDLCPPHYFEKYAVPFLQRSTEKIHSQNMVATSHWDGFIKQLIPLVKDTGLDGLECVTPLPQGDFTISELKNGLDDVFIRDGIPAVMVCPWTDVKVLESFVKKLIEGFYPRIILGISDMLPANGEIKRVKLVNEIVKEFNSSR
jgi:hypothetical protein